MYALILNVFSLYVVLTLRNYFTLSTHIITFIFQNNPKMALSLFLFYCWEKSERWSNLTKVMQLLSAREEVPPWAAMCSGRVFLSCGLHWASWVLGSALGSSPVAAHLDLTKLWATGVCCSPRPVGAQSTIWKGKPIFRSGGKDWKFTSYKEAFWLTSVPASSPKHPVRGMLVWH